jgi:hypothetical protein
MVIIEKQSSLKKKSEEIGPTTKNDITSVNKLVAAEKPPRHVSVTVEKTGAIGNNKETFITQKGGKMY